MAEGRNWFTNRWVGKETEFVPAIEAFYENSNHTHGDFSYLADANEIIPAAVESAIRSVFDWRFEKLTRPARVFIYEGRHGDNEKVHLEVDVTVDYRDRTFCDFLNDTSRFLDTFNRIIEQIKDMLTPLYPNANIYMQHHGNHRYKGQRSVNYIVSVVVEPATVKVVS